MPRYCLFGNTVNLTSRTETTGHPGRINVSEDTYRLLQQDANRDDEFVFQPRGFVSMKGRSEPMMVWFLSRKPSKTCQSSSLSNEETKKAETSETARETVNLINNNTNQSVNQSLEMKKDAKEENDADTEMIVELKPLNKMEQDEKEEKKKMKNLEQAEVKREEKDEDKSKHLQDKND